MAVEQSKSHPQSRSELTGALVLRSRAAEQHVVPRGNIPPEQLAVSAPGRQGNQRERCTVLLGHAACCLFQSTSDVGEGWVQQCHCGALPSCCPAPSAPCTRSRRGVTCGPCMSKNAGMWIPGYLWGETCPSTRAVGVCSASR